MSATNNIFLYGNNKKSVTVSDSGNLCIQQTFKLIKSPPRVRLSSTTPVSLQNCPCGFVMLINPTGNNPIYYGGVGDDMPYLNLNYSGDNKGIPIYAGQSDIIRVENANLIHIVGTDNEEIYYIAFLNQHEDITLDYTAIPSLDSTPPTVVSVFPTNGATSVPVNTDIYGIFSEDIDHMSIDNVSFTISPAASSQHSIDTLNPRKVLRTLTANLSFSTVYTATLKTGIMDMAGNNLAANYPWSFTTAAAPPPPDTTPPTILSKSPDTNASGVSLNTSIVIVFSENLLSSTVNTTNFVLLNNVSATVPSVVSLGADLRTVTITPNDSLNYSNTYTMRVTTGVKDVAGNSMASQQQWNFTTISQTYTVVYNVSGGASQGNLDDNRTGAGLRQMDTSTASDSLYHTVPKKATVYMKKVGSPAAGTIYCRVRNFVSSPSTVRATLGTQPSSAVTLAGTDSSNTFMAITFENAASTYVMQQDDCIIIEYEQGAASNYLSVQRQPSDVWTHGQSINWDLIEMRNVQGYDLAGIIYI